MKKPSVVLVGDVCIDHNSIEGREYESWGSATLFMGVHCSERLGLVPDIITSYGSDFAPFKPDSVRFLPLQPNAEQSLHNANVVVNGNRKQYSKGFEATVLPKIDDQIRTSLQSADIIVAAVLTPVFSASYLRKVLAIAPKSAVKILCPSGYFRDIQADGSFLPRRFIEADELLPLFDMVSLSIEDYPDVISAATEWTKVTRGTPVIITEAERGAIIVQDGQVTEVPTVPIALEDIVDPTGAGDVFAMSAVLAFAETRDIVSAIRAGHHKTRTKLLATQSKTPPFGSATSPKATDKSAVH